MPLLQYLLSYGLLTKEEHTSILRHTFNNPQYANFLIFEAMLYKEDADLRKFIGALQEEQEHKEHRELAETLQKALDDVDFTPSHEIPNHPEVSKIIYPHMPSLIEGIEPHQLVPFLRKRQLLTSDEVECITGNPNLTRAECNHRIIASLCYCGSRAVEDFIRCLIEEREHLAHHELAYKLINQLCQEHYEELAEHLKCEFRTEPSN